MKAEKCGACLGTGTIAKYYNDGSFEPDDCEYCEGQGSYKVDNKNLRHGIVTGRFV